MKWYHGWGEFTRAGAGLAIGDENMVREALADYKLPTDWLWRRGPIRCPHQLVAPALHMIDRDAEAIEAFEAGLEYSRKVGDSPGIVWLNTDYVELLFDRNDPGDLEHATTLRDEAVTLAENLGMKPHLGFLAKHTQRLEKLEPPKTASGDGATYPDGLWGNCF